MTGDGQDPVKAIVQDRFGPPEVRRLADTGLPEAVLVRVHAAALNPAGWHILWGDPLAARLMGVGLTRPKARAAGIDAAGVVEAADANVRGLASGDQVPGFPRARSRSTRAPRRTWWCPSRRAWPSSRRPRSPIAATTVLRGIRDVGRVTAGQRVLVNGAGGGGKGFSSPPIAEYDRPVAAWWVSG